MPNAPRKQCATPRCSGTTSHGGRFCPACTFVNGAVEALAPAAKRESAHSRGYSLRWQKYTARFLVEHPYCVDPLGRHAADYVKAEMVDHIIPPRTALDGLTLNTKEKPKEYHRLFWDPKNHRAVCKSCNSAKAATLDRYLHARG